MDKILSFGAGVQTTALAILISERKLFVDAVIFADTGCEKPETYDYIETYTKPLMNACKVPFIVVKSEVKSERDGFYEALWRAKDLPSIVQRRCTDHFKCRPIEKLVGHKCIDSIGFSLDEIDRAKKKMARENKHHFYRFPLIKMGMRSDDSRFLIAEYGWPIPLKSSCYICPFQPWVEWNWLKNNHPDLFQKALDLEENYYKRKPHMRTQYGLFRGKGLWTMKEGLQPEMLAPGEYSCWEGHCGH